MKDVAFVMVLSILVLAAFALGRWTRQPEVIVTPAPTAVAQAPPASPSIARARARLEDVRRDWGIEGRLVCESRIP